MLSSTNKQSPGERLVSIFRKKKEWPERMRLARAHGYFTDDDKNEARSAKPFLFYAEYRANWPEGSDPDREFKMGKFGEIFRKSVSSNDVQLANICYECMKQLAKPKPPEVED